MFVIYMPVSAQSAGFLKTKIDPGRAGVFIDGKYVGPAKNFGETQKYSVASGEHEVRLSEPRYHDLTSKVTIQSGKTLTLSEKMKPLPAPKPPFGRLRTVTSDKFAAVYINDQYMGHADEFSNPGQRLLIAPGTYTVKIAPANGGPVHQEQVTIAENKDTIVRVK